MILVFCFVLKSYSQEKGAYKDPRDGKEYKTVIIGTQTWLAENLAYKPSSGNFWAYDNNLDNIIKYGYLYDWETAKKVAPVGWHLPSKEEWDELYKYLGGSSKLVYEKLIPNGTSGFMTLFGGIYLGLPIDKFYSIGDIIYFWSSTAVGGDQAYRFYCDNNPKNPGEYVGQWGFPSSCGLSVRLLKDK